MPMVIYKSHDKDYGNYDDYIDTSFTLRTGLAKLLCFNVNWKGAVKL